MLVYQSVTLLLRIDAKITKNKDEHIPSGILLVVGWSWETNNSNTSHGNLTVPTQCHPPENRASIRPAISCWSSWHWHSHENRKNDTLRKLEALKWLNVRSEQQKQPKFSSGVSWTDSLEYLPGKKTEGLCFDVLCRILAGKKTD